MRRKYGQKLTTEEISNVESDLKEARIDEYKCDPKVLTALEYTANIFRTQTGILSYYVLTIGGYILAVFFPESKTLME